MPKEDAELLALASHWRARAEELLLQAETMNDADARLRDTRNRCGLSENGRAGRATVPRGRRRTTVPRELGPRRAWLVFLACQPIKRGFLQASRVTLASFLPPQ
jgi:hypothetical protein